MPAASRQPLPQPRILTERQVEALLGKGAGWLRRSRSALEAQGFPPKLPYPIAGYNRRAVEGWLDRHGGAAEPKPEDYEAAWLKAAEG